MSWHASATLKPAEDLEADVTEAFEANWPEASEEVKDQFNAARDALRRFLEELPDDKPVSASLSGHVHSEGDAPSYISINVSSSA